MRQKLLLIAGWAVAAVGSSAVASGAVAVAGGQVTDRPLRLLSASEVAAIPIINTVAVTDSASEPPASGGSAGTVGSPGSEGAISSTGNTLARQQSPTGDGGGSSGSPPGAELLPADDAAPTTGAAFGEGRGVLDQGDPTLGDPISQPGTTRGSGATGADGDDPDLDEGMRIVVLTGGTVAVSGEAGRVELQWATPRAGYTVSLTFATPDALVVSFVGEDEVVTLRAYWAASGLVVETTASTTES